MAANNRQQIKEANEMFEETICVILILLAIAGFAFTMFWMINKFM